ncbi:hypothetical protein CP8484711_0614, partial [Chlamydia psittaci 84-8471/1]
MCFFRFEFYKFPICPDINRIV